jgi:hypothetical protein
VIEAALIKYALAEGHEICWVSVRLDGKVPWLAFAL